MNFRGSASIGIVIFTTFIIVCIVFPIASFGIEKSIIYFAVENISDSLDISAYSLISDLRIDQLSQRNMEFFEEELEERFNSLISSNLLNESEGEESDGIIENVFIEELEFFRDESSSKNCIRCKVAFSYRPTLYRSFFEASDEIQLHFERDIEIPENN